MFCPTSRVFLLSYLLYYNFITYFTFGIIVNNDKIVIIDDDDDANTDGINQDVSVCVPATPELNNISSKFIKIRNDNADKISLNQYHYEDVKQKDISNDCYNNDELYSYIDNGECCSCAATHRNIDVMNTNSTTSSYVVTTTTPSTNPVDNDNIYSKNIDSKDYDVIESSIIATTTSSSSSSSSNCNDHFMIHELNKKMVRIEGGLGYMGTNKPIKPTDGEYPLRAIDLSTYLLDIYEVSNNGK